MVATMMSANAAQTDEAWGDLQPSRQEPIARRRAIVSKSNDLEMPPVMSVRAPGDISIAAKQRSCPRSGASARGWSRPRLSLVVPRPKPSRRGAAHRLLRCVNRAYSALNVYLVDAKAIQGSMAAGLPQIPERSI